MGDRPVAYRFSGMEDEESLDEVTIDKFELLDRVLGEIDTGMFHYLLAALSAMTLFVEASEVSSLSLVLVAIKDQWGASDSDVSNVASMTSFGMVTGVILFGKLASWVGRRPIYIASLSMTLAFGFISSFASTTKMFAFWRMLLGVGYGGNLVITIPYLIEFLPSVARGKYCAIVQTGYTLGATFVIVLCGTALDVIGWQWVLRISSLIGLPVLFALIAFVPDSPRYLVMTGRFQEAVESVETICRVNKKEFPNWFNEAELRKSPIVAEDEHRTSNLLLRKSVLVTLGPLLCIWFFQAFGSTYIVFLPLHLREYLNIENIQYSVAYAGLVGNWLGAFVILCFPRYLLRLREIRAAPAVMGICIFIIGFNQKKHVLTLTVVSILYLNMSVIFHGLYTYTAEVFPTKTRVAAFSACQLAHRMAPVGSPVLLTFLESKSFLLASVVYGSFYLLVSLIAMTMLTRETLGMHIDEKEDEGGFKRISAESIDIQMTNHSRQFKSEVVRRSSSVLSDEP